MEFLLRHVYNNCNVIVVCQSLYQNIGPATSLVLYRLQLVMRRASLTTGFGFTVSGSCPVRVGRVTSQSAAAEAGMKRGDLLERVDSINVSRSAADSVAALIR